MSVENAPSRRPLNAWLRFPYRSVLQPALAVALGLAVGLLATFIAGDNPWNVLSILGKSAFGSLYDFGMTLFYATPLILTGLAVAIPFQAGLFNIGAEGQLAIGALCTAAMGILFPGLPSWIAIPAAIVAGFVGGGIWGAIPGWLKARRGSHEVITTIMMNFIASGITSYVTLYLLKGTENQNPETLPIGAGYALPQWTTFGDAPVTAAFAISVLLCLGFWFFFKSTKLGFQMQAVGENETAARTAGIRADRLKILAMLLAGGLAGLVGLGEVLGYSHKFKFGFSPGYGFTGIAVALLARGQPLGVIFAGLLFGALHKGTADLDLETENVTRDVSLVLQACVILSVSAEALWERFKRWKSS